MSEREEHAAAAAGTGGHDVEYGMALLLLLLPGNMQYILLSDAPIPLSR